MPIYLAAARIKQSVERLSDTRGKAALLDFLILKRTLVIKGASQVAITKNEQAYLDATKELAGARLNTPITMEAPKAIFNVFASADAKKGFRAGKYISNGTNTTIGSPPWQTILSLTTTKPRVASFRENYQPQLADLLLRAGGTSKPSLREVAVFRFRQSDIEPFIGGEADPERRAALLDTKFIEECQLNAADIAALFETGGPGLHDEDIAGTAQADPAAYLPGLAVIARTGQTCSLDLVVALASKPFAILSGTSGTGKSRSTLKLAEQIQDTYGGALDGRIFQLVPIGPDWTSPKRLLGYRTPFGQARLRPNGEHTNESYEITETLRIILRAWHPNATSIPHFLVFDEMNLSHVERYFAPFLSLMEATSILEDGDNAAIVDRQSMVVISELLQLSKPDSAEAYSARLLVANDQPLSLPPNLFYVGTVNIDETTHMFSPKVLDRAHVLEVRALTASQYVIGGTPEQTIQLESAHELLREAINDRESGAASNPNPAAVVDLLATKHEVTQTLLDARKDLTLRTLDGCFKLLGPVGFEFAFRVVMEVHAYLHVWIKARILSGETPDQAMEQWVDGLDRAIFQKVLPKIHGSRAALGDSLKALHAFLGGGHAESDPPAKYSMGDDFEVGIELARAISLPAGSAFTRSREKLAEMNGKLLSRNYASFVK